MASRVKRDHHTWTRDTIKNVSGDVTLDLAGDLYINPTGGQVTITDDGSGDPDLIIKSTSGTQYGPHLHFKHEGNAQLDNDIIGTMIMYGQDDAGNTHAYSQIASQCIDVANGAERGTLILSVSAENAIPTQGLLLTSPSSGRVDATLGATTSSMTTIAGDLDIDGDSVSSAGALDVDIGGPLTFDTAGDITFDASSGRFHFQDAADSDDAFAILVTGGTGATSLTTASAAADGHLTLDSDGDMILDSGTGKFIAKKAGTEFSAADSAYAGMVLGYTRIANTGDGALDAIIALTSTMAVLQTVNGTDVSIAFTAPPSGNVEIIFTCNLYTSSTMVAFALSDNSTFNEVDPDHTYGMGSYKMDETDTNTISITWAVTGLTAGTSYTYYIGADEVSGSSATIYHGDRRGAGVHYPPITVKAIALPATITTGS